MNNFQNYLIYTLLKDINEGLKLRKKYTKAFDKAFKYCFGESFGVEIEINPKFFKPKYNIIDSTSYKLSDIFVKIREHFKNTKYSPKIYTDSPCWEYTLPIDAKSLYLSNIYLHKLENMLQYKLGTFEDDSSSMHIHSFFDYIPEYNYETSSIYHDIILFYDEDILYSNLWKNYQDYNKSNRRQKCYDILADITNKSLRHDWHIRSTNDTTQDYSNSFGTLEIRCFYGSTDLRDILLRALFSRMIITDDTTLLNLLLKVIGVEHL